MFLVTKDSNTTKFGFLWDSNNRIGVVWRLFSIVCFFIEIFIW